jgi:hypothetical protein
MSIGHTLSGPLESSPSHVYDRTRTFDETFGHARPPRNGLVQVDGTEAGHGSERKRCAITGAGVTDVQRSGQLRTTRALFHWEAHPGAHPEAPVEPHPHRPMPTTTRLHPLPEAVTR